MKHLSRGLPVGEISKLGLGCSRVGSLHNSVPMPEIRSTLASALDLGVNLFDTSNIYGQGDSEREIGRVLGSRREEAFIVTKVGKTFSAKMRAIRILKPLLKPLIGRTSHGRAAVVSSRESNMGTDFAPASFAAALDASLRRLRVDIVDGYILHSPPAHVAADPAVGEALMALRRTGKVRHFGVSCDDLDTLRAATTMPGISIIEVPLDVLDAAYAEGLGDTLQSLNLIVLAREVIRFSPGLSPIEAVKKAAMRADVTSVVVGISRTAHLQQLAAAVGSLPTMQHAQ